MDALRQCCHAKIQGMQKARAQQLQALEVQLPPVNFSQLLQVHECLRAIADGCAAEV